MLFLFLFLFRAGGPKSPFYQAGRVSTLGRELRNATKTTVGTFISAADPSPLTVEVHLVRVRLWYIVGQVWVVLGPKTPN